MSDGTLRGILISMPLWPIAAWLLWSMYTHHRGQ